MVEVLPAAGVHEIVVVPPLWESSTPLSSPGRATPWPVQVPALQASSVVHALPSSQGVPSALAGFEQDPVPASQRPAS